MAETKMETALRVKHNLFAQQFNWAFKKELGDNLEILVAESSTGASFKFMLKDRPVPFSSQLE